MSETENLTRKKKVRAAHCASVTCMITQAQELLSAEGGVDPPKLRHKREALAAKAELLMKLDKEIVEAVHEDELEEVGAADAVRERIKFIVIELDSALNAAADKLRLEAEYPELHGGDITRERPCASESRPITEPPHEESPSHVPPDHPLAPVEMRTSTTSTPADPSLHADPGGSPVELLPHSSCVKLPKLSLKRFNGDPTKWMTFWDTFESAVHDNAALTNIDKFSYLISLLESTASEAVAGLTLTSANYEEAVATLKRRFGNKQLIINRHMDLLLHHEPVASPHNLKGMRRLFDAVESNVRGLLSSILMRITRTRSDCE